MAGRVRGDWPDTNGDAAPVVVWEGIADDSVVVGALGGARDGRRTDDGAWAGDRVREAYPASPSTENRREMRTRETGVDMVGDNCGDDVGDFDDGDGGRGGGLSSGGRITQPSLLFRVSSSASNCLRSLLSSINRSLSHPKSMTLQ